MSKPEQNWDWASQEAQQIEDEYITQESLRELISDALRKAAANERALVQAEIEGLIAERDHYRKAFTKLEASDKDWYLAGAAAEREAGKRDVAAIRLMGASQPDLSYQEGFADACDNIEYRIRQRGEGDERK